MSPIKRGDHSVRNRMLEDFFNRLMYHDSRFGLFRNALLEVASRFLKPRVPAIRAKTN